jgi:Ca2+-binding RTX toxin-like protein
MSRRPRSNVPPAVSIDRRAVGLGAVLAGLLAPQVAHATTASVVANGLVVRGEGVEANRITIAATGATYTVTEAGASIDAGSGCTGSGPVTCTAITTGFVVDAGDGADEVTVTAADEGQIDGGAGDDELRGGAGAELILGGSGVDELLGGGGPDIFDGGADRDLVSYEDHAILVQVTLDGVAGDGSAGELDNVMASVEDVAGGPGSDSLTGDSSPNLLRGGAGRDMLEGLGGLDSLEGGDGDDLLSSVDLGVDVDLCGSGLDSVLADTIDTVGHDCEAVRRISPPASPAPPPGDGMDVTAPSLTRLRLTRAKFAAAPRGPSARPARRRIGTKVSFRLSEDATVSFVVTRRRAGRRVGGRCRKPTRRNRSRRKCDLRLKGGLTRTAAQGGNSFWFAGRLRGRKLQPGRYHLIATARDGARNRAKPARVRFTIVRR